MIKRMRRKDPSVLYFMHEGALYRHGLFEVTLLVKDTQLLIPTLVGEGINQNSCLAIPVQIAGDHRQFYLIADDFEELEDSALAWSFCTRHCTDPQEKERNGERLRELENEIMENIKQWFAPHLEVA